MQCRSHLLPGSRTVRKHESRPSAALGGRSAIVHTGQCLGGGGSVNCAYSSSRSLLPCSVLCLSQNEKPMADFVTRMDGSWVDENGVIRFCSTVMQYVRASASDYDDWKTVHGNPGWGSDDLIPLLKKVSWILVAVNSGHFYHPSLRFVSHMADARLLTDRPRRIKLPETHQRMELTARSRSPEVRFPLTSEINTCRLSASLIPLAPGSHLTPTRTISKPSMCIP